jgi:amino acid permease
MDGTETPITRDELLGGLVARRASTSLFAVERRVAYLVAEARHVVAPVICADLVATHERAFLAALASGRGRERAPTIQELERFAPAWRHLAPGDADGRAVFVDRLATAHRFRRRDVPRIRAVLALDDGPVATAFRRRTGRAIATVYATDLTLAERGRWWRGRVATRLGDLPPFWMAFALTLTQTVGAGILALPIALAGVGPLPGVALLVVLGLVNVLTVAAIAESFARTGTVRWGGAFLGRVVTQYLGRPIGAVLGAALVALSIVVLAAYHIGLSTLVAAATGVPASVWISVLFAVTLAAVVRGRVDGTIASALIVGAINLAVIVVLSLLALRHLDVERLTVASVPFVGGRGFEPALLGLTFGVGLLAYFGHTAAASCATVVLRRDPSGRGLVRGTASAMVTVIALYSLWTVAIGGAVPSERLAEESGTALEPLAEVVGPIVYAPGTVFAVLAMGMGAVVFSLGVHHQVGELFAPGSRAGRIAGLVPLVLVFVAVQALVLTGRESFTGSLSFIGVVTAPLVVGIVPVLLLVATRRRGDYVPAATAPLLRRRSVLVAVHLVFVAALLAHGLVIWTAPAARATALVATVAAVVATGWVIRSGALRPSATLELRRDAELARYRCRLIVAGRRATSTLGLTLADGSARTVAIDGAGDLPERTTAVVVDVAGSTRGAGITALEVWLHEVTPDGASRPLAARVTVDDADEPLPLHEGRARIASGAAARLTVELEPAVVGEQP